MTTIKQPVLLCILDGFGLNPSDQHNAIKAAHTPHLDRLMAEHPMSEVATSGEAVGLPEGQMGNSEVGHMTIGAGRIILQTLPRIDKAIADGELERHIRIRKFSTNLHKSRGNCHMMGLLSDGGVHAHMDHLIALARIMNQEGITTFIHAIMDGRDTPPKSGKHYLQQLEESIKGLEHVSIATVSGRYYAMDRDNRWDRVEKAYDILTHGNHSRGPHFATAAAAVEAAYQDDITDEFIPPATIGDYEGMTDGDGLICSNFRADRAREILHALLDQRFDGFIREGFITFEDAIGMIEYSEELNRVISPLFPAEIPQHTLGEIAAKHGLRQLRIAETEKYAHVTFFLNGGVEAIFDGEDRVLVPSPDVATYDLKPEMSAPEVTKKLVEAITSKRYPLMIVNYANTDMVGHSGNMEAAVKAVEAIDEAVGKLEAACRETGTAMIVTADHGNAEQMYDTKRQMEHTQHTLNPVPMLVIGAKDVKMLKNGGLADIAPTVLEILGVDAPDEMTGISLVAD